MNSFEIAKKALREHILANKEKVRSDLDELRKKSSGMDVFAYAENLGSSLAISKAVFCNLISYDDIYSDILNSFIIQDEVLVNVDYSPPEKSTNRSYKKDSEIFSESFFLI